MGKASKVVKIYRAIQLIALLLFIAIVCMLIIIDNKPLSKYNSILRDNNLQSTFGSTYTNDDSTIQVFVDKDAFKDNLSYEDIMNKYVADNEDSYVTQLLQEPKEVYSKYSNKTSNGVICIKTDDCVIIGLSSNGKNSFVNLMKVAVELGE